tara:strand:+ start:688 stop:1248 length:561 start_codon:yes stop_codon:yes gene_type:complete
MISCLFLGYDENKTRLISELKKNGCSVENIATKVECLAGYDLIISFGYRHILSANAIRSAISPIINLHMSYLPWNRGAHPNFWSFYDETPKGVTIHYIEKGIDTGPIIFQKIVTFTRDENTFKKTYRRLFIELEDLFISHINEIINHEFKVIVQSENGSFHNSNQLPFDSLDWDASIETEIKRLKS